MYRDLKRRIDKLQQHKSVEHTEILQLIQQGAYYDELTEEQKDLYFAYLGQDREAVETLKDLIYEHEGKENNWRHEKLSYKEPPIPKEREAEYIKMRSEEIAAYLDYVRSDLDAEEQERRSSEWSEWSDQREAAFRKGESWKKYKAPAWASGSN